MRLEKDRRIYPECLGMVCWRVGLYSFLPPTLSKYNWHMLFMQPVMSDSATPGVQHARPPCPSPSPRVCPSSRPLHQWCHPASSSSDTLFCSQSFQASETFTMTRLFISVDQTTRASASASVLPVNIQGWFPLVLTGLISLLSKGLSGVFSSTTVQKHQFSRALPSLWSGSYNWHTTLCKFKAWHVVFIHL